MGNAHTREDLKYYQSLPLNLKIAMSKRRIRDFIREYGENGVYIAFSGGKDSTVLLNLVREEFPKVEAVFCDTGLEYPAIRKFVNEQKNVKKIKPPLDFRNVLIKYGYPIISKEVANNLEGARRYIKILTDRQTDRQTDRPRIPYSYNYRRICGIGEYSKKGLGKGRRKSSTPSNLLINVWEEGKSDYP